METLFRAVIDVHIEGHWHNVAPSWHPAPDTENTLGHSSCITNQNNMTSKIFSAFLLEPACLQPAMLLCCPSAVHQWVLNSGIFCIRDQQIDWIIFNYWRIDGSLQIVRHVLSHIRAIVGSNCCPMRAVNFQMLKEQLKLSGLCWEFFQIKSDLFCVYR